MEHLKLDNEIWKPVPGFEESYYVSSFGRIKAIERKRQGDKGIRTLQEVIRKSVVINKYYSVYAKSPGKKNKQLRVHRIVAQVFVPNPDDKPHVNHIDCNKFNNHYTNLEWVTPAENNIHARDNGRTNPPKGTKHWHNKLDEIQVLTIRRCLKDAMTQQKIADYFKVHRTCVSAISCKYHWAHL